MLNVTMYEQCFYPIAGKHSTKGKTSLRSDVPQSDVSKPSDNSRFTYSLPCFHLLLWIRWKELVAGQL